MGSAMPLAAIALEDPGFPHHRGIIAQALENSLKMNVEAQKFVRGCSTITMQLAKNIWLRRDKSLGRKVQEAILALSLESCLNKDEILALYLNVVEYGANLYGIGPAAHRYFKTAPAGLDPVQAFYLASILPAPKKASPPTEERLKQTAKLMRRLAENGHLPEGMAPPEDEAADVAAPAPAAADWGTQP